MAAFQILVRSLRRVENELEAQLAGVKAAISSLAESGGLRGDAGKRGRRKGKASAKSALTGGGKAIKKRATKMSAAGRAAISAAQKKRWAAVKAAKGGKKSKSARRTR